MKPHPFWVITGTMSRRSDTENDDETWVVCVALTEERATTIVAELEAQRDEVARQIVTLARWRWSQTPLLSATEEERTALSVEHEQRWRQVINNVVKMDRGGFHWNDWRPWTAAVKDVARKLSDKQVTQNTVARLPFYDAVETSDDPTGPDPEPASAPAADPGANGQAAP